MRFRIKVEPRTSSVMNVQRLVLALLLSFVITFGLVAAYLLSPLLAVLIRSWTRGPETAGIASVAGGISSGALILTEFTVFAVLLLILSRRKAQ